jgi:hypothetical protein
VKKKGIGTIVMSIAVGIIPQVLVIKGIITQANANYWLIGAGILFLTGVYLLIHGIIFKPKTTSSVLPINSQEDLAKEAARIQLSAAQILSDGYRESRRANRIIRFILLFVGLGLIVWGGNRY